MTQNAKFYLVVIIALVAIAFVALRTRTVLVSRAPDWVKQVTHRSPARWMNSQVRHSWARVTGLLEAARREAAAEQIPLGYVRAWVVQPDLKEIVSWTTETLVNPGFQPMSNFEHTVPTEPARFLGYYTLDGEPLSYTVKHDPRQPKNFVTTIHLTDPVAPGATGLVFEVIQVKNRVVSQGDQFRVDLYHLPGPGPAIRAEAVALPEGAHVFSYEPAEGPQMVNDHGPLVIWMNDWLEPGGAHSTVTFQAAR